VDASEHPIQRPKKTKIFLLWKKEKAHFTKPNCGKKS
jgi:hypothetical protein